MVVNAYVHRSRPRKSTPTVKVVLNNSEKTQANVEGTNDEKRRLESRLSRKMGTIAG